jgi:ribulose kinase
MWIKENCPSVYERTYKFLTPKDFIVMRLTRACPTIRKPFLRLLINVALKLINSK